VEYEVRQDVVPDVAEEMLRVARDTSAQVLVIGIRHRTPVGKMIMGSVAQHVLLDAPCPVLAVTSSARRRWPRPITSG
jgi:nucleotide-binding universal stress UspA family protein